MIRLDDHLVGVRLLNDLAVIHFYPYRIIRIATVLDSDGVGRLHHQQQW
jgi:hypothetical protein